MPPVSGRSRDKDFPIPTSRLPAFRDLVATDHFLRLAAHAYEFRLTRHGLFLKVGEGGKMHTWYSGNFPAAHMLARSSDLAATSLRLLRLGKPEAPAALEEAGKDRHT